MVLQPVLTSGYRIAYILGNAGPPSTGGGVIVKNGTQFVWAL